MVAFLSPGLQNAQLLQQLSSEQTFPPELSFLQCFDVGDAFLNNFK